jgi:hypothetical protein
MSKMKCRNPPRYWLSWDQSKQYLNLKARPRGLRQMLHRSSHTTLSSPVVSVVVVIPLLVSAIIIRLVHSPTEGCDTIRHVVPPVFDVLWDILDILDFLSCPPRCIFWKVLHVVDCVIEAVLDTIVEVLNTANLLAGPASSVFWEVGNIVAELVEAVFDTVLVALKIVLYDSNISTLTSCHDATNILISSPSCINSAPPATPATPAAAYFHPLPPDFFSCSCCS